MMNSVETMNVKSIPHVSSAASMFGNSSFCSWKQSGKFEWKFLAPRIKSESIIMKQSKSITLKCFDFYCNSIQYKQKSKNSEFATSIKSYLRFFQLYHYVWRQSIYGLLPLNTTFYSNMIITIRRNILTKQNSNWFSPIPMRKKPRNGISEKGNSNNGIDRYHIHIRTLISHVINCIRFENHLYESI